MLAMPASRKKSVQKLETQGILLIVIVIVIYVVARYWHNIPHNIPWRLR
jgi:t-SNARE complex subunit (syntaxin)